MAHLFKVHSFCKARTKEFALTLHWWIVRRNSSLKFPSGLKGNRLLLSPRTANLCLSQTTCTPEASCEKTTQHPMTGRANVALEGQLEAVPKGMNSSLRPGGLECMDTHKGRPGYTGGLHFSPTWRQFEPCSWSNTHISRLPRLWWPFKPWLYTFPQCLYKTLRLHIVPIFTWIVPCKLHFHSSTQWK